MKGKMLLYVDQYGQRFWAKTVRELKEEVGGGRISKMYVDDKDGNSMHCGYVIGQLWLSAYKPVMLPA